MTSVNQINLAKQIAQDVIDNGRVVGEDQDWLESLRVEVEFECRDRGHDDCEEIAETAVNLYS